MVLRSESQNIEDHSQIVRFVSTYIADGLMGIVRAGESMGVDLLPHRRVNLMCEYSKP